MEQVTWKAYLAEAIATAALVIVGAGAVLANAVSGGQIGVVGVALAFGAIVAVLVYSTAHLSGAHFNPAITLAAWATGKIGLAKAFWYLVSQLIGAGAGGYLLGAMFPNAPAQAHLGVTKLAEAISPGTGVLIEAVLTFLLAWTVFGVALDNRAHQALSGLAVGLVIAADILVGAVLTGASMNPARTFGPALASGYWVTHWVYWVGPIVGAVVAGLLYHYVFAERQGT